MIGLRKSNTLKLVWRSWSACGSWEGTRHSALGGVSAKDSIPDLHELQDLWL